MCVMVVVVPLSLNSLSVFDQCVSIPLNKSFKYGPLVIVNCYYFRFLLLVLVLGLMIGLCECVCDNEGVEKGRVVEFKSD